MAIHAADEGGLRAAAHDERALGVGVLEPQPAVREREPAPQPLQPVGEPARLDGDGVAHRRGFEPDVGAAGLDAVPHGRCELGPAPRIDVVPDLPNAGGQGVPQLAFEHDPRAGQMRLPPFDIERLVKAGTNLEVTGWFDNSDRNPANPDPDRTVRWGPQTFDEMLLGYIEYYVPGKQVSTDSTGAADGRSETRAAATGETGSAAADKPRNLGQRLADVFRVVAVDARFEKADTDRNGRMSLDEARQAFGTVPRYQNNAGLLERHFRFLDANSDGFVTGQEFTRVSELGR